MNQSLEKFNPAALAGIIGAENVALINSDFSGGISGGEFLPMLSIKGNRFRIKIDGQETVIPENSIQVYLVASRPNVSKTFYKDGYSAGGDIKKPDCSSADGTYPDDNVEHPVAVTCQVCPNNAWGSKITQLGKQGKACNDYKMIVLALKAAPDTAFALRIPAASLKPFSAYIQKLKMAAVPANAAITQISLGDTEYPSLMFDFVGTVETREDYTKLIELSETIEVKNAVQIKPRIAALPAFAGVEEVTHAAAQSVVAEVEEAKPVLADLLKKGKKKADPEDAVNVADATPAPVEVGAEISSIDQLLAKMKSGK